MMSYNWNIQINPAAKGTTESHVAHVENEVKVRASNIVCEFQ